MPELSTALSRPRGGSRHRFSVLVVCLVLGGLAYHVGLIASPLLRSYRFPIPYSVPIFDSPFILAAVAVGYLCMERHRLRQDYRSAYLGVALWLAALFALAHILTQPDYPEGTGVNPGVAPYFFILSYLASFASVALAVHQGDRPLPLSERGKLWIGLGVLCLSGSVVIAVLQLHSWLPPLVVKPGRYTPFGIWVAGTGNGALAVWAFWGGVKKFWGRERDWFAGFLLLAALIWILGLTGLLLYPFRYSVSWYIAGLVRPIGIGAIFLGLLREQVWLYREARARQRDLESLHAAGQALLTTLHSQGIADTIASRALELCGADAAALFRLDMETERLRLASHVGQRVQETISELDCSIGEGIVGLAAAMQRPVWTTNILIDERVTLTARASELVRLEGERAVLAIPVLIESGEVFGVLSVSYRRERTFEGTDIELLSAFGTQAAAALQTARAFDQLALRARNDGTLRAFSQRLLEVNGEEAILNTTMGITQDLLQVDWGALFLFDSHAGCLRLRAGHGWEAGTVGVLALSPSADPFAGHAFLQNESIQVPDLAQEYRFQTPAYLTAHGVRAGLVVPVGVHDQSLGVLGVYYQNPHRFSEEEKRIYFSLAHQTALALERVRLLTELQANLQRLQDTQAQLMQADKLKALGTLLSGMAHELNGPLTSILLSVQLLREQHALNGAILKRIDEMEQECIRASRIIKDLLVFARHTPPERRPIDINGALEATLALLAPELQRNNVRVLTDLQPAPPPIWADAHQLQQVFLNLFTNAIHAMKTAHGQGTLTVRSSWNAAGVCVSVEDDGPGVPSEDLGRIFDPFFTTKGMGEGTGLGLSLSLGIVEAHGGHITAQTLPGAGARFVVELPLGEGVHSAGAMEPSPPAGGVPARILIVEDEAILRVLLTDVIGELGHQVDSTGSGQEAMARLEQQTYDLVTLDLGLPDMDGKDLWHWILARDPALASRVVFMTGDTMSSDTQRFLQAAGAPMLSKPMTTDEIRGVVSQALQGRPADAS